MYLNERSIIENYIKSIMEITIEDNIFTNKIFEQFYKKYFNEKYLDNDEWSLIKNEYMQSCKYIHGGSILSDNLVYDLNEFINKKNKFSERNKYYKRLQKILKILNRIFIIENVNYINECFHRKKSIMEYLVGKECVDLLFKCIK